MDKGNRVVSMGVLYIIHANDTYMYKIGVTDNLDGRLRTLSASSPIKLSVYKEYHILKDVRKMERELHKHFDRYRSHGEWFMLPDKEIKNIDKLVDRLNVNMERREFISGKGVKKIYKQTFQSMIDAYYKKFNDKNFIPIGRSTRSVVAEELNVSDTTMSKLLRLHRLNPKIIRIMDENDLSINYAYYTYTSLTKEEKEFYENKLKS